MKLTPETWRRSGRARIRGTTGFALMVGLVGLVGCADVPDELNPVEWYAGVAGWFDDDKDREAREQAQKSRFADRPVPGADEPFPNLASVPPRPKRVSSTEQRKKSAEGLVADREHARYADLEARGGSAAFTPAPAPQGPVAAGPIAPPAPPRPTVSPSARSAPTPLAAPAAPARADVTAPSLKQKVRSLAEFERYAAAVSFRAAMLRFPRGSAKLSAKHREVLRDVLAMYRVRGGTLRVIGHASGASRDLDPAARKRANLRISIDRANAVAKELIRLGVKPGKLFVGGKSDREPIYYELTPAGDAGNQRAEIYIDN